MTITLQDVARLAGVSVSTASRALTGDRSRAVAPGTQERIWEAVRELDYHPKAAAHRLMGLPVRTTPRTYRIGLLLDRGPSKFTHPFWSGVIEGIDAELRRQEHRLAFAFLPEEAMQPHQQALLTHAHVDGIILVGGLTHFGEQIDPRRVVIIAGGDDRVCWQVPLRLDVIVPEKNRVMHQMVRHLMALGHRHLAFLGPSAQHEGRAQAFVQAQDALNLPRDPALLITTDWTIESGYEAARSVLRTGVRIDAMVCAGDEIAIGVMRAAKECGRRLPEDLAVTGFDDIPFARELDPPLTTVRTPRELLGQLAVRKLVERITQPDLPPVVQVVPTALVVRESCGARRCLSR